MVQAEIKEKTKKIQKQIRECVGRLKDLGDELKALQKRCTHPHKTSAPIGGGEALHHCPDCGHGWFG